MTRLITTETNLHIKNYDDGFSIVNSENEVLCEVQDGEVSCVHSPEFIEWSGDDEQGECLICGAKCDWGWSKDVDDNYPDYINEIEVREPTEWYERKGKGLAGDILNGL